MAELAKDAEIAFVLPMFNKFGYGMRAALSCLKYTKRKVMIIAVDDASPKYPEQNWDVWKQDMPPERLIFKHFGENGGLTRSWNWGLSRAKDLGIKYTVCSNSDVLFTPDWEDGLVHQLDRGYHLIGPVSNASGVTNGRRQQVENYFPGYQVTHNREYLAAVSKYLKEKFSPDIVQGNVSINGFFMMAKTETWWKGAFSETHVFDPAKKMTGNEDELQRRWHRMKMKTGFVPSSFIFHYRSVSRGERYRDRGSYRLTDLSEPI